MRRFPHKRKFASKEVGRNFCQWKFCQEQLLWNLGRNLAMNVQRTLVWNTAKEKLSTISPGLLSRHWQWKQHQKYCRVRNLAMTTARESCHDNWQRNLPCNGQEFATEKQFFCFGKRHVPKIPEFLPLFGLAEKCFLKSTFFFQRVSISPKPQNCWQRTLQSWQWHEQFHTPSTDDYSPPWIMSTVCTPTNYNFLCYIE